MSLGTVPKGCVRRSFNLNQKVDEKLNRLGRQWKKSKTEIIMLALQKLFDEIENESEIKRAA